jgi:chromosome segregation protein
LYLKRLEINGFKSFAHHTEMLFEKGVTAIVGPNGSGKSNISDAVRWVLGEQSSRMLRGSRREDVIFNGTQKRRPMQYCEVSLTFENQDMALPIDFAEVSVTRRLYRSGESEYLINRAPCRLKDIVDLFRDTGIGKDGYSIIGQGRVDDILSAHPENRRLAFEEAAGIVRHRVRKEEARKKLAGTLQNLQRLDDILEELGSRLGPLEEQSKKAREYLQLSDELKRLELALFARQYEHNEKRLKDGEADMSAIDQQIRGAEERSGQLEAEVRRTREDVSRAEAQAALLQQRRMELSERVSRCEGDERVLTERMESLRRESERIAKEIEAQTAKAEALKKEIALRQTDAGKRTEAFAAIEADNAAKEDELRALDGKIASERERIEGMQAGMMDALNSLMDVRSKAARLGQAKAGLEARLSQLLEEQKAALGEREALEAELGASQSSLVKLEKELRTKLEQASSREKETIGLRSDAEEDGQRLRSLEKRIHEKETRRTMLEDMARDYEGYSYGVKMILRRAEEDAWLKRGVYGVLGDLITVPAGLETALEVALGSAVGNVVTATDDDAKELIRFLHQNRYGRATFYPVSTMRERSLNERERALMKSPGCLGVAADLVGCDQRLISVVRSVLGRTAVTETLDQAVALARRAKHAFKIVTLAGDVLSPGGAMTGGSRRENDTGPFMRKRALSELIKETDALYAKRRECEHTLNARQEALEEALKALEALKKEAQALEIRLAQAKERHGIVKDQRDANARRVGQLEEEKQRLDESMADVLAQMEGSGALQGDLETSQVSSKEEIAAAKQALQALAQDRETLQEELTKSRIRLAAARREQSAAKDENNRLGRELDEAARSAEDKRRALAENEAELRRLAEEIEAGRARAEADRLAAQEVLAQIEDVAGARKALLETQAELEKRREALQAEKAELQEKRHKLEMQLTKLEVENRAMQERIWEDYETTYASAKEYALETGVREAAGRAASIKASIRLMGPVNVSAVDEYRDARERFDYLSAQREDMHKAREDLEGLIADLEKQMRKRFREQFALINENFKMTFTELFGGGSAQLRLTDADDVLESDIEIIAQPPGKKLQSISLLSGGEKALTAIAILFAMLRLKPSPFCILDEIETSLDDVNVVRFAKYLRNYSERTQFIIITHRKDSMAESDILYGITMEEKGVSKMVSVRLSA